MVDCFVAETEPARDAIARDELRSRGFTVIMPTYLRRRIVHGAVAFVSRPVMPGYLLVSLDLTDQSWSAVKSARGVKRLLGGRRPIAVDEDIVAIFLAHCGDEPTDEAGALNLLGNMVRVISGPFIDFNARCIEIERDAGRLLLSVFGRQTKTWFPLSMLERMEA